MENTPDTLTAMKIIKVSFFEPVNGKTDWYFGCLGAIYEMFPEEAIGIKLASLRANPFTYKSTRKCTISKLVIYRKRQQKKK